MRSQMTNENPTIKPITEIAQKINLEEQNLKLFGNHIAKITAPPKENPNNKLVLVTSTNPTPYGEGKTTLVIGINDALIKLNQKSLAVLREPSKGPVFGIKGGATGGGLTKVLPEEDINLHFTGDIAAIESANNLIAALIDNHLYQGNELNIDPQTIAFKRCLDVNDRSLRNIIIQDRKTSFDITAASEMMAIICLSKNKEDLKERIDNILIAYTKKQEPVYFKALKATNSVLLLLKDALLPNLVQSLEHNPVLIHGGPFANIAHGCNSLISTNLARGLSDYTIVEAGFGSDLGAEKFFDIKCRFGQLKPHLVIINVTIKALKYHSGLDLEASNSLTIGLENLKIHLENMKLFSSNLLVVLNKFTDDKQEDIAILKHFVATQNIPFEISEGYQKGGEGCLNVAEKVLSFPENNFNYLYELSSPLEEKIIKVCKSIYRAKNVIIPQAVQAQIDNLKRVNLDKLPICIAKTPLSLTSDPKHLVLPKNYDITLKNIEVKSGAGFIVVYLGDIFTMPGLPKVPNACQM